MSPLSDRFRAPEDLLLGRTSRPRVAWADQQRQGNEIDEILTRFKTQPGIILADEVGMGKTFVALGVAYAVSRANPSGPVVVMVPAALLTKWELDLRAFAELYIDAGRAERHDVVSTRSGAKGTIRYGIARHSIEFLKMLDDPHDRRCNIIFLSQSAMSRRQTDKWVRLALIAEALRRHAKGKASKLSKVRSQIHRFLARLIEAIGEERNQHLGPKLWQSLLKSAPDSWKDIYNQSVREEQSRLIDAPVPKAVSRALSRIGLDLTPLAEALKMMPIRAVGGSDRVEQRIATVRTALRAVEEVLWKSLLRHASWRSPLLIMDEAHHLKNSSTGLARQLASSESTDTLRTGDGAMARTFDRMLFLTATPFQLGHHELVNVLRRFGDVREAPDELEPKERFLERLELASEALTNSQRKAIAFQRAWSKLDTQAMKDPESWWTDLRVHVKSELTHNELACLDSYEEALQSKTAAESHIRPWVIRHNKGKFWSGTQIERRLRLDGAAILLPGSTGGLTVPHAQMLPFYLAARSAAQPSQDLLGEALCSSFEAFRHTRKERRRGEDTDAGETSELVDLTHSDWYLREFDRSLGRSNGADHPKVSATVKQAADLWEAGEKVVVFAFYRLTCRALRLQISEELNRRIFSSASRRFAEAGQTLTKAQLEANIERVRSRFFEKKDSRGARALDRALRAILDFAIAGNSRERPIDSEIESILEAMKRFLGARPTIARSFPLVDMDAISREQVVERALDESDTSGQTWRAKFAAFASFLIGECSQDERAEYVKVVSEVRIGSIRVDGESKKEQALPNVQLATGDTKREIRERLMRAFNTPFFPEILVCSQVMGEGVDLQRYCRHVIHHDLDWNPSTIEQRTGRVDRLSCKAERRFSIKSFLPYIAGTADERQYHVMMERERWFRVVMGQDTVASLVTPDSQIGLPLPGSLVEKLTFDLALNSDTQSKVPTTSDTNTASLPFVFG